MQLAVCNGSANGTPHEDIAFSIDTDTMGWQGTISSRCPLCAAIKQSKDLEETVDRLMSDR